MKKNIIRYNLYAVYDTIAKTLSIPFVAQNNETAIRKLNSLKEELKKEGIKECNNISVMYLGQYYITPIEIKDAKGVTTGYESVFTDTNNVYDLLNCFTDSKARETTEE